MLADGSAGQESFTIAVRDARVQFKASALSWLGGSVLGESLYAPVAKYLRTDEPGQAEKTYFLDLMKIRLPVGAAGEDFTITSEGGSPVQVKQVRRCL